MQPSAIRTFVASAKFKVPGAPSELNAITESSSATPPAGTREYPVEHVLDADRSVESPPGLTSSEASPATTVSPSSTHNTSVRSAPPTGSSRSNSDGAVVKEARPKPFPISPPTGPDAMRLSLPNDALRKAKPVGVEKATTIPQMFSILIVSEQPYSRIAISHNIKVTLPKNIPNQITYADTFSDCADLIAGDEPVIFTHLVISLPDHLEIISLFNHLLKNPKHSQTVVLVLTNPSQRTAMLQHADKPCDKMASRLQFIYKPIKPSRFGDIFDPTKERDASMDRHRDSAQQVVETQKRVFARLEHEVGNKGYKVLLVEDNRVNQKVLRRFLDKVGLLVETASDGEECIQMVFSKEPGHYGLILCDLHMPRKDGFQTTAEIRAWEKEKGAPRVPIVALSANVMSDVADKCVLAGFSRYVTKPVDFKELSMTIKELLPSTGCAPPGSPEVGDREIEELKERDQRELAEKMKWEAHERRELEAAMAAADEAAAVATASRASSLPASPQQRSTTQRTWSEWEHDERIQRDRGKGSR